MNNAERSSLESALKKLDTIRESFFTDDMPTDNFCLYKGLTEARGLIHSLLYKPLTRELKK